MEKDDKLRKKLTELIRNRKYFVAFGQERPTRWWFGKVIDPRNSDYFTIEGSWDFIAQILEEGYPIKEKDLDKPSGEIGYVLLYDASEGQIYIKFELCEDAVIGRSFHYSHD